MVVLRLSVLITLQKYYFFLTYNQTSIKVLLNITHIYNKAHLPKFIFILYLCRQIWLKPQTVTPKTKNSRAYN